MARIDPSKYRPVEADEMRHPKPDTALVRVKGDVMWFCAAPNGEWGKSAGLEYMVPLSFSFYAVGGS